MFRSLRVRLGLSHALVFVVLMVVLGGVVQFLLARSLDRGVTMQLLEQASAQANRIVESGTVQPPVDTDVPSAAAVQIAVYRAPSGSPIGEPREIPSWLRRYPDGVTDLRVAGEDVRVVTVAASSGGRTVAWVSAGRSLEPEDRLLHRVRLLFLSGGLAGAFASLGAGWWLGGRAVRPVEDAYHAQAGFAADASHELRTPLAFIRSGVEVLAERDQKLGADVLAEVDYLTGLTSRLLRLARAERGAVEIERGPVDLADVCRSAVHRSEGAHGNRLTLGGDEPLVVPADRDALEAALDAVLENGGRHGGGSAEVRWERDGREATVSIADHGPGLPPDLAGRAFDRFFRADPSRTRGTGGAGLGLALARALVTAQGGRIWIDTTDGGGMTARIALPLD